VEIRGGHPTPFFAALGLDAVLGLELFGVRATWVAIAWGDPRASLLSCARPGRCAWFSSAGGRAGCVVAGPKTPFSSALGLAAALSFPFFGGRARWKAVVEGDPRAPLFRCARPCHCARLGLLRRACELGYRSRGRPPNPYSPQRLAWPMRFGFLLRVGVLCCVVVGGDPPIPPSPLRLAWSLHSDWPS
jgi:hypothetical protein